ncbi:MAG: type II toxin-antitoxin system RelE/ParE family toxin [Myxacorys chilensis ATA2-1-KO14]|jgi:mRNA interferase RelE/StbE|nr:type II toxin-antitoxin system RelE/ParE family toxin [Myxacorys chilensis ATA2-1-KO14]
MSYSVVISKSVQKQIKQLPASIKLKVQEKIVLLQSDPRPSGVVELKGYEGQYRLRVCDYRIRYEILEASKIQIFSANIGVMSIELSEPTVQRSLG